MTEARPLSLGGGRLREFDNEESIVGHVSDAGASHIVVLTAAAYDALTEPDAATLYLILEGGALGARLGDAPLGALAVGESPIIRAFVGDVEVYSAT